MRFQYGNRIALVVASLLFGLACSATEHPPLDGAWVGTSVANFKKGNLAQATGWALGTRFEFRDDRVTVHIPAEEPRAGRYQVTEVEDNVVKLQVARNDGTLDLATFRVQPDRIHWLLGGDREIELRRAD